MPGSSMYHCNFSMVRQMGAGGIWTHHAMLHAYTLQHPASSHPSSCPDASPPAIGWKPRSGDISVLSSLAEQAADSSSVTSRWILHLFHAHPPGLWALQLRPRAAATSSLSPQMMELVAMSCLALNPLVTIKALPGVPYPPILARCMDFQPCTLSRCPTVNQRTPDLHRGQLCISPPTERSAHAPRCPGHGRRLHSPVHLFLHVRGVTAAIVG